MAELSLPALDTTVYSMLSPAVEIPTPLPATNNPVLAQKDIEAVIAMGREKAFGGGLLSIFPLETCLSMQRSLAGKNAKETLGLSALFNLLIADPSQFDFTGKPCNPSTALTIGTTSIKDDFSDILVYSRGDTPYITIAMKGKPLDLTTNTAKFVGVDDDSQRGSIAMSVIMQSTISNGLLKTSIPVTKFPAKFTGPEITKTLTAVSQFNVKNYDLRVRHENFRLLTRSLPVVDFNALKREITSVSIDPVLLGNECIKDRVDGPDVYCFPKHLMEYRQMRLRLKDRFKHFISPLCVLGNNINTVSKWIEPFLFVNNKASRLYAIGHSEINSWKWLCSAAGALLEIGDLMHTDFKKVYKPDYAPLSYVSNGDIDTTLLPKTPQNLGNVINTKVPECLKLKNYEFDKIFNPLYQNVKLTDSPILMSDAYLLTDDPTLGMDKEMFLMNYQEKAYLRYAELLEAGTFKMVVFKCKPLVRYVNNQYHDFNFLYLSKYFFNCKLRVFDKCRMHNGEIIVAAWRKDSYPKEAGVVPTLQFVGSLAIGITRRMKVANEVRNYLLFNGYTSLYTINDDWPGKSLDVYAMHLVNNGTSKDSTVLDMLYRNVIGAEIPTLDSNKVVPGKLAKKLTNLDLVKQDLMPKLIDNVGNSSGTFQFSTKDVGPLKDSDTPITLPPIINKVPEQVPYQPVSIDTSLLSSSMKSSHNVRAENSSKVTFDSDKSDSDSSDQKPRNRTRCPNPEARVFYSFPKGRKTLRDLYTGKFMLVNNTELDPRTYYVKYKGQDGTDQIVVACSEFDGVYHDFMRSNPQGGTWDDGPYEVGNYQF